ncbi:MAG: flagellar hook-length control protein FliK [Lachnospiraceae bacterium]|nr:flagellar hook-length control protein FliK [Lachnospiraceae bacterium]
MALNIGNLFTRQPNINTGQAPSTAPAASAGAPAGGAGGQSLPVGSVVSGQVVKTEGDTVTLRTDAGQDIQAKMESTASLSKGSYISFEVSGVSDAQITLKPLFTNTAAGSSTMSTALSQAGIPEDANSFGMVRSMMENGMSIDKSSLQAMYRLANAHPEALGETIVDMTKLGLALTDENITQFEAYKNLEHQINGAVSEVSASLAEAIDMLSAEGDPAKTLGFLGEVTELLASGTESGQATTAAEAANATNAQGSNAFLQILDEAMLQETGEKAPAAEQEAGVKNASNAPEQAAAQPKNPMDELMKALSAASEKLNAQQTAEPEAGNTKVIIQDESVQQTAKEVPDAATDMDRLMAKLSGQLPEGRALSEIADGLKELLGRSADPEHAARLQKATALLQTTGFKELLSKELSGAWKLDPQTVADKGKVQEFYEKLRDQSTRLENTAQTFLGKESQLFEQTSNIRQNVDFMNQLNQTAAYVQLPLRLNGDDAHGDLYVYTNKKSMAAKDGKISAFLHLDMDHMGPVDVYVAMEQQKVSTNFYLRDDEMIDFISENIGILNDRLADKGYDMTCEVKQKPAKEPEKNVMQEILEDHRDGFLIGSKSFDVLA